MATLRIVRLRKHYAQKGGKYLYFHADVLAPSVAAAVKAAVEERVTNWRLVDDFNPGQPESFEYIEVIVNNLRSSGERVREPLPVNPSHRWHRGVKEVIPSEHPGIDDDVRYYPKTRNLALEAALAAASKTTAPARAK